MFTDCLGKVFFGLSRVCPSLHIYVYWLPRDEIFFHCPVFVRVYTFMFTDSLGTIFFFAVPCLSEFTYTFTVIVMCRSIGRRSRREGGWDIYTLTLRNFACNWREKESIPDSGDENYFNFPCFSEFTHILKELLGWLQINLWSNFFTYESSFPSWTASKCFSP